MYAYWAPHTSNLELSLDPTTLIARSTRTLSVFLWIRGTAKTLALQRNNVTTRNVAEFSIETGNYLELVVHSVFDTCPRVFLGN